MSTSPRHVHLQPPAYSTESTARQLSVLPDWDNPAETGQSQQRRATLTVVPAPLRKAPKWFIATCVAFLLSALMVVLVVNISISNRQYELLELRSEQLSITQQNEKLSQQAAHLSAPQNVASGAIELGMVLPSDVASIDLSTGRVIGTALPAEEDNVPTDFVAAPQIASERGTPARAPAPVSEPEVATAAPEDVLPAPENASDNVALDTPSNTEAGNPHSDAAQQADLNGGTIPAPRVSSAGLGG